MRFVSRETACPCDIRAGQPLNGVQEVAGSNPVAPTSEGQSGQQVPAGLFSHLEGSSRGRAELRAEFRKRTGPAARAYRVGPGEPFGLADRLTGGSLCDFR